MGLLFFILIAKFRGRLEKTKKGAKVTWMSNTHIQGVPGGKVNILGGNSIGHSKQKCLYEYVSYSERFPR